jgi:hypothetical protein
LTQPQYTQQFVEFPPAETMVREYLIHRIAMDTDIDPDLWSVHTRIPRKRPSSFIRFYIDGGPMVNPVVWACQIVTMVHQYGLVPVTAGIGPTAEVIAFKVMSWMTNAAGRSGVPGPHMNTSGQVMLARHISGPENVGDTDVPDAAVYRIASQWFIYPSSIKEY